MTTNLVFLVIVTLFQFYICTECKYVTIQTQLGRYRGISTVANSKTIYNFNGIRYGKAPVGDLRFHPSEIHANFSQEFYDATKHGSKCIQPALDLKGGVEGEEDCLFLNIFTTKSVVENREKKLVPVMFWIHGGSYAKGSGDLFNGTNLVSRYKDVVFVSINYRLGPMGFLNNKHFNDDGPYHDWQCYGGLNGLHDVSTAWVWVQSFIGDYGGDKNQITIFGESAGGCAICTLLASRHFGDMVHRAIIESGPCIGPWGPVSKEEGFKQGDTALRANGWPTDNVTFLRSLPAEEFVIKMSAAMNDTWTGAVDDCILHDVPENIFLESNWTTNADRIIAGFNSMDGTVASPWRIGKSPSTEKEYKSMINHFIDNETLRNRIYSTYYPPSDFPPYSFDKMVSFNRYQLAWWTMNGDVCVLCPTLKMARYMITSQITNDSNSNSNQGVLEDDPFKVFVYNFKGPGHDGLYYAPHASEIPFIFDNDAILDPVFFHIPWDQNLSDSMLSSWINMARDGTPNVDKPDVVWNAFESEQENVLLFQSGDGGIQNIDSFGRKYRNNVCDFWDNEVGAEIIQNICDDKS